MLFGDCSSGLFSSALPAGRFVTCCWLVVLVFLATLLVGPSSTSNSGAHAAVQTCIAHWNFNNGQAIGTTYALPVAASSGSGSGTTNFAHPAVPTYTETGRATGGERACTAGTEP